MTCSKLIMFGCNSFSGAQWIATEEETYMAKIL